MKTPPISPGSRVTLHYTLALEDGYEVDSSRDGEALTFTLGDGTLVTGLEAFLVGMRGGEVQSYRVAPEQAFGYPDPANVHDLPRDDFPVEIVMEPGLVLSFAAPSGEDIPGTVLALDDTRVQVDFNHPLAGLTLQFDVEIVDVQGGVN